MDFEFQDSKSRLREFQGSHKKVEKVNIGEKQIPQGGINSDSITLHYRKYYITLQKVLHYIT